jgi:hypothetical protein
MTGPKKKCTKCKRDKTYDNFYKDKASKNGYKHECMSCFNERQRNIDLRRRYGIDQNDLFHMIEEQHGACLICEQPISLAELRIDHNHTSGIVRGLLCHHCNVLIGHAKEDVEILTRTIEYLEYRK